MKKNTFLFIFLLFSLPLFVEDNLSIKDDQFTFITTVKGTDPSSLNEAMVFGFRGIILRLTGDSKVLNLATIKQETRKAKNYVDSYQFISDTNLDTLEVALSFNKEKIRSFIELNELPFWIGQNTKILFYLPCLNTHLSNTNDNEISRNICTNAEKELIRLADYRSIVMIKPSLDFIDMMAVNSSTSESISFILNKVAARYGLSHWLSCFAKDEFGRNLSQILCQSNLSSIRSPFEESISQLVDTISKNSQLVVNSSQALILPILVRNILDSNSFKEIQKVLRSFLVVDSFEFKSIRGSDVYFDITLNSNIIDFKKLIDISPKFFLLDTEDILAFKYNPDDTKYP